MTDTDHWVESCLRMQDREAIPEPPEKVYIGDLCKVKGIFMVYTYFGDTLRWGTMQEAMSQVHSVQA